MSKMINLQLIPTAKEHLDALFEFQLDKEAGYMAAFTSADPGDKAAFLDKWIRLLNDPEITMRTIKTGNEIAGSIAKFMMDGNAEITYWIGRKFWGQGIATKALRDFLNIERTRPLFARTAFDNYGSQRVLEKCGFVKTGVETGFANARQQEIEEFIYKLTV